MQSRDHKCILLVDDDDGIRSVVGEILREEGFHVVCACNGMEALALLRSGVRPCVILLDLMMPLLNGWEFLQLIKQAPDLAQIPVVILSGIDNLEARAASLGARVILRKPVELDALLGILNQISEWESFAIPRR